MKLFRRRQKDLTEAEILEQISKSIRIAYGPTPIWLYLLYLVVAASIALAVGYARHA